MLDVGSNHRSDRPQWFSKALSQFKKGALIQNNMPNTGVIRSYGARINLQSQTSQQHQ